MRRVRICVTNKREVVERMSAAEYAQKISEIHRADTYESLRDDILYFRRTPGEPLSENRLAAQFGISRTPVRDAIARLASEGLVEVFPQRGSAVSRISAQRVREFLFMREVLECAVVERAARNFTSSDAAQFARSIEKQRERFSESDGQGVLEEDQAMFRALYIRCGLGGVWDSYRMLQGDTQRVLYLVASYFSYRRAPEQMYGFEMRLTAHRQLLDALSTHDGNAAVRITQEWSAQTLRDLEMLEHTFPHYFERP